jgi:hypothetical protein
MTSKDVDIVWEIIRIALDREESIAQTHECWANRPMNDKNYDLRKDAINEAHERAEYELQVLKEEL